MKQMLCYDGWDFRQGWKYHFAIDGVALCGFRPKYDGDWRKEETTEEMFLQFDGLCSKCKSHLTQRAADLPCCCAEIFTAGVVNPDCPQHGSMKPASR